MFYRPAGGGVVPDIPTTVTHFSNRRPQTFFGCPGAFFIDVPLIRHKHPAPPLHFLERAARRKGRPKGQPGWLGSARHLFWSWWLWIGAAAAFEIADHWNIAVTCAAV